LCEGAKDLTQFLPAGIQCLCRRSLQTNALTIFLFLLVFYRLTYLQGSIGISKLQEKSDKVIHKKN